MITLACLIERFEADCLARYPLLPSQRQALQAIKRCRTSMAPRMLAQCPGCNEQRTVPHSCGHRSCPHCQHFESQRWLQRQSQRLVGAPHILITFTLPAEMRPLAWQHQRVVYAALMECAWQTLHTFSLNHRQLQGTPGAMAVLHTHARSLEFHPHVHLLMPAAALDANKGLWRTLRVGKKAMGRGTTKAKGKGKGKGKKKAKGSSKANGYLFNHEALATVFRAKLLAALHQQGLTLPPDVPPKWVVDCKGVGDGRTALVYLGRYLYRGVIQEKDIVACDDSSVTYRWRDSKTAKMVLRTVPGATFLWLLLRHVLPKGFRRSRNFGFLHPNSKRLIALLRLLVFRPPVCTPASSTSSPASTAAAPDAQSPRPPWLCACCGAAMVVVRRRILPPTTEPPRRALRSTQEVCTKPVV